MRLLTQFQNQIENGLLVHEQLKEKSPEQRTLEYAAGVAAGGGAELSKGSMAGLISSEKMELTEKQKKDQADLANVIEQQRQIMLSQLNTEINNLSQEIEQDQIDLSALDEKRDALTELNEILVAEQFNNADPNHMQLVKNTGLNVAEFAELSTEDQLAVVNSELHNVETKITKLIDKISSNMDKLDMLVQAKEDLENGVSPEDVRKHLENNGVHLTKLSENNENIINRISRAEHTIERKIYKSDIVVEELDAEELSELINQAELEGISKEKIDSYKDELARKQETEETPEIKATLPSPMG